MNALELGLLPSGHLHCFPSIADDTRGKAIHSGVLGISPRNKTHLAAARTSRGFSAVGAF